ncbi:MAG: glycosyltransferase family 2 protein, partial [Planctomycetota bacterium]
METLDVSHDAKPGDVCAGISVVVAVFNSEKSLGVLVQQLGDVLSKLSGLNEVLLINDGSRDQSWQVICGLAGEKKWVRGVNLMRNYGQHNALLCGVRLARFDVLVTLDDDLQHSPKEIPKLLAKLREGYDVVYARPQRGPHTLWRNFLSRRAKATLAWVT